MQLGKEIVSYLADRGVEGLYAEIKFGLVMVNTFLTALAKKNVQLTKQHQRLKKHNMEAEWPLWKSILDTVEIA